ncbi:MAG: hypothetical protein P1U84_12015 [Parvibaculaceae bacterium]|nr:hypothetical protein [Parvibaculaceae bacterium]
MVSEVRPFSLSTYQALKTATRSQLGRFGKQENAAEALSTVQSAVSDWTNPNRMDRFMPIDKALDAAALTGSPDVVIAMARELGYVLVAVPEIRGDGVLVKRLGEMAKETSEAITAIASAIAIDGDIKPDEITRFNILTELTEGIEKLVEMRALVREIAANGGVGHG